MTCFSIIKSCSLFTVYGSGLDYKLARIAQKMSISCLQDLKVDDGFRKKVIAVQDLNVLWSWLHSVRLRNQNLVILSYAEKTNVFEIKDGILSKVFVPEIYSSSNTLAIKVLENETVIQITSQGIHTSCTRSRWRAPQSKRVEACALNHVQAILLLEDTSLHYVTIDEHARLTLHPETIKGVEKARCILLSNDTYYADFSVIGTQNSSIFVISLRPDSMFQCFYSIPNLNHPITSLLSCRIGLSNPEKLQIMIGLLSGELYIVHMVLSTGRLKELAKYRLGKDPVKLFDCGEMVIILTNFTWVYLERNHRVILKRIYSGSIEATCNSRESNKVVFFSHPILRVVYVDNLHAELEFQPISKLNFSPLKIIANPKTKFLFFTELVLKEDQNQDMGNSTLENKIKSSRLHVYHLFSSSQYFVVELADAVSCSVAFTNAADPFTLVGTKKVPDPSKGALQMLKLSILPDGQLGVNQLDRMELEAVPYAMEPFEAGVLVGVGKELRMYYCSSEMKLMEEYRYECALNCIVSITSRGHHILVTDSEEGFVVLKYNICTNKLEVIAKNLEPASICCFFGPDSIARTDTTGNITLIKYYGLKEFDSTEEELFQKLKFRRESKREAGPKAVTMANISIGENVLSMQMASLFVEGQPVLLYSTLSGSIGFIVQFQDNIVPPEDAYLVSELEKFMLKQDPAFCQDYITSKAPHMSTEKIVNGDLCEQYCNLSLHDQDEFSNIFSMTSEEIVLKLAEIKSKYLF